MSPNVIGNSSDYAVELLAIQADMASLVQRRLRTRRLAVRCGGCSCAFSPPTITYRKFPQEPVPQEHDKFPHAPKAYTRDLERSIIM